MALTEEHKAKMAAGREAARQRKLAAQQAQPETKTNGVTPASVTERAPARSTTPVAAGGPVPISPKGIVPREDELFSMQQVFHVLKTAKALPRDVVVEAQAMALMLKGWELDLPPIQSMEGLWITEDGMIAMKADLMRALVQRSGKGLIVPVEMTNELATVEAVRYGVGGRSDRTTRLTYTLDDAERAGFLGNDFWKRHPRGCLFSKVTGELARAMFDDVLKGACYTPEELLPVTQAEKGGGATDATGYPTPGHTVTTPAKGGDAQPVQEARPEPTPALPLTPPTGAVPAGPGAQPEASLTPSTPRELTHSFQVQGPQGQIEVIRTAGLTQGTRREILRLAQGNDAVKVMAKTWITTRGQPSLVYLTELEGVQLLNFLAKPPQAEAPPVASTIADLQKVATEEFRYPDPARLIAFVVESFGKATPNELSPQEVKQAIAELRHIYKQDPKSFPLIVERAAAETAVR